MEDGNDITSNAVKYDDSLRQFPKEGEVLEPVVGDFCLLVEKVKTENRKVKSIYYCNAVFDVEQGKWVLTNDSIGLKCIISKKDRHKIPVTECGVLYVRKLKVKKIMDSKHKSYVICDIVE